jgi:hypothetical protein
MEALGRQGFTDQEVKDMLHGKFGSRVVKFRYDLLDRYEKKKGELQRVRSGEVSMNAFNTIKRSAKFTLEEEYVDTRVYYTWSYINDSTWSDMADKKLRELWTLDKVSAVKVDWLNDRVQPFIMFQMQNGEWVEFPMGIFLLSSPTKKDEQGTIVRQVEAYDGLIILDQDKFTERMYFKAGTLYEEVVKGVLRSAGITKVNMQFPSGARLQRDKEYATGDSKLTAVNDLLNECNNTPVWVDASGYFRSSEYERPDRKSVGYTYSDQELSIIVEGIEEELDLFDIPNSWVVTMSNPEDEPLTARKENTNADSLTSIPARGRKIVDFRQVDDISSQEALESYIERIASEASQVYGSIKFSTPIMPMHEYYDVLELEYEPLSISGKFAEASWTIKLEAGAEMTHEVRKVVSID